MPIYGYLATKSHYSADVRSRLVGRQTVATSFVKSRMLPSHVEDANLRPPRYEIALLGGCTFPARETPNCGYLLRENLGCCVPTSRMPIHGYFATKIALLLGGRCKSHLTADIMFLRQPLTAILLQMAPLFADVYVRLNRTTRQMHVLASRDAIAWLPPWLIAHAYGYSIRVNRMTGRMYVAASRDAIVCLPLYNRTGCVSASKDADVRLPRWKSHLIADVTFLRQVAQRPLTAILLQITFRGCNAQSAVAHFPFPNLALAAHLVHVEDLSLPHIAAAGLLTHSTLRLGPLWPARALPHHTSPHRWSSSRMLFHPTVVAPQHRPIVTERYAKSAPNVKLREISAQRHGSLPSAFLPPAPSFSPAQRQALKFSATTVNAAHDVPSAGPTQGHHVYVYLHVVPHLCAIIISLLRTAESSQLPQCFSEVVHCVR
ncbi:hypothetical protein C8F01DRAFT_1266611 [Mycena amicta]|nr:hypothetical protein C8F01DRAFT_1266611 [Mycena amicta]